MHGVHCVSYHSVGLAIIFCGGPVVPGVALLWYYHT